ncbi:aminoglycoside phosphotransferase family protein [Rhodosalinus sp. 5P4]|uniref:aminoglycoside phosphotransferase family protein n=1 Tax=Rhodosalinus sp. 5P4 TaxID=3239196 RepID=UPI0035238614
MADRARRIAAFLAVAGWEDAAARPLAGDASSRRYARLRRADGAGAVLMDADPATGETVRPFRWIARHLLGLGLSAPRILAADETGGLLLLEDLGDALVGRVAAAEPAAEPRLYAAAAGTLAALHRHAPPDRVDPATPARLAAMTDPAFTHYAPEMPDARRRQAVQALEDLLARHADAATVLVLRDFHAENLIWLPERDEAARIGLLDFQDAIAGHPAYDLASLLTDARRDVSPAAADAARRAYLDATGTQAEAFGTAMAVLGVQRNLRILGVFARLARMHGKPGYLGLLPRVWAHLQADLSRPALATLSAALDGALPPPSPAHLETLRRPCPTP